MREKEHSESVLLIYYLSYMHSVVHLYSAIMILEPVSNSNN